MACGKTLLKLARKVPAVVVTVAAIICIAMLCPEPTWARNFGPHEGYLSTTTGERDAQVTEMVVIQPPKVDGPTLRDRIFNDKLSKEFRDRYEEKFGRTEAQRVYSAPNKFTYYDDLFGFRGTPQDDNAERRRFGEFMVRRLAEWHFDNYAKSDPKVRPMWEAKEKLSKVAIEVAQFRLDMVYTLSGNIADINFVNPWMRSRISVQMDPASLGPGPVNEAIFSIGKNLTPSLALDSYYYAIDGVVSLIGRKSLTPRLSTSISASTFTKSTGRSPRESVYLSGLTYVF